MKVYGACLSSIPGGFQKNYNNIMNCINDGKKAGMDIIVLPRLAITSCFLGSLFDFVIDDQQEFFDKLLQNIPDGVLVVTSIMKNKIDTPVAFCKDNVVSISNNTFNYKDSKINICFDLKSVKSGFLNIVLGMDYYTIGSLDNIKIKVHKASMDATVVYVNCGGLTSGGVFKAFTIMAKNGTIYNDADWDRETLGGKEITPPDVHFDPKMPFVPTDPRLLQQGIEILTTSLEHRLNHIGCEKCVVGVSGGLDSTLTLLICCMVLKDKRNVHGITMPGFGTTDRTYKNAIKLMSLLDVSVKEISIKSACENHFIDIGYLDKKGDITFENAQARERMQILFDYANKIGGLNVGTGDMSELILGFTTFGGDHMSMYGLNSGVPKTLVSALIKHIANNHEDVKDVLYDIIDTPISPELLPQQHTEDIIGSYMLNDFFMHGVVVKKLTKQELKKHALEVFAFEYSEEEIENRLNNFYNRMMSQQFKRNCMPDGPRVIGASLNPKDGFTFDSTIENFFNKNY